MRRLISPKLILALDVDTLVKAERLVDRLYPKIDTFKVGSYLFTRYGPRVIEMLRGKRAQVFLDLKYLDIPNTVAKAVSAAVRLKVKMLTLHISGGRQMLSAAVVSAKKEAGSGNAARPLLIGITVLTSQKAGKEKVLSLAKTGIDCGLDGVVCSANEAGFLRRRIKKDFVIVTPGIRSSGSAMDDQKRVATVSQAVRAGSNFLVIGRPILKAKDPLKTAEELIGEAYGAGDQGFNY
ncbi:MAG: orotidine-5'-phosphate decarboxylase [Candidatus Omnitrophica bacterium]|nr:orotidine-5'-phosphate decarboxylase [Candidatus Omnitrophota bacterium]MDD5771266.1 orotidine-5'-phosphate decarboxylase [Candidatus Omnitrophota bacterium]